MRQYTIENIMRHCQKLINMARERGRRRGVAGRASRDNKRLKAAVDYGPIRSVESYPVFELGTHNPRTGQRHLLEIKHDVGDGNNRYSVYIDGNKWRKPWSRFGFCRWLFTKIDSVVIQ